MALRYYLTNSSSSSFKFCRRRYWYEYELGLRPLVDARALRMGTAFHELLRMLAEGKSFEEAILWVKSGYVETDDLGYEWATVETLVRGYDWRWSKQVLETLASEQTFILPLLNPATGAPSKLFSLGGKIDGILKLEDGRFAVLEHKLLGEDISSDSEMWRRLQIDQQISLYVYAARQLGWDVSAVLYDVARKPTIKPTPVPVLDGNGQKVVVDRQGNRVFTNQGKPRQTVSTGEGWIIQTRTMTAEEWSEKLLFDIQQRPEYYFARMEIARLDSEIDEVCQELWDQAKAIRDAQRFGRWYRTVSRNTCPFCPYWGPCSSKRELAADECPEGFQRLENVHPELDLSHDQICSAD